MCRLRIPNLLSLMGHGCPSPIKALDVSISGRLCAETMGTSKLFLHLSNSNVEKMVSIPRDILLRGKMCELPAVNRTLGLFEAYKNVVLTGVPFITEARVHAEDVTSEWVEIRAERLEDGIAVTASDIADRKRAERDRV
jgi:hypothetical protein